MPLYAFNVTFNGGALESQGLAVSQGTFFFDPMALLTFGFVYGTGSTWVNDDDCVASIWTSY